MNSSAGNEEGNSIRGKPSPALDASGLVVPRGAGVGPRRAFPLLADDTPDYARYCESYPGGCEGCACHMPEFERFCMAWNWSRHGRHIVVKSETEADWYLSEEAMRRYPLERYDVAVNIIGRW